MSEMYDDVTIVIPASEFLRSGESTNVNYYQPEEHLRLIFRDCGYAGFYDPALESVI